MTTLNRRNLLIGSGTLAGLLALPRAIFAQPAQTVLRAVQPWEFETIQPFASGFVVNRTSVSENLIAISPEGRVVPALAVEWSAVLRATLPLGVLSVGGAVLSVSSLGFPGLGIRPPDAEWGAMISEMMPHMAEAPVQMAAPCLAIFASVLVLTRLVAVNDPRERRPTDAG